LLPFPHKLLLLLALAYTLVNAVKPLTIDDTAYQAFAAQAARHPLDPYGFSVYWWNYPDVANEVLAPPLLAYWWAPAIRLFGDTPFLWKMWLLPLVVPLTYALYDLARRFARGLELPLVALALFSPALLPTLNLMLDVPAMALSLGALALFARACDRGSFVLAALAGLVAGLGVQMKYTGLLTPAAMLLYAVCLGRLRLWPAAAVVAAQVFLSWEFLMSLLYGESHFLMHARYREGDAVEWGRLMVALTTNLGSLAWAVALLALAALGVRWRGLIVAGALGLLAYVDVAYLGENQKLSEALAPVARKLGEPLFVERVAFGLLGLAGILLGVAVVWRLVRPPAALVRWDRRLQGWENGEHSLWRALTPARPSRATLFLLLWLALEVVGYARLTPFPAVRRLLEVFVVITLIAGRLAALTCLSAEARRTVWGVVAYSAVLGLLVYGVDLADARAEKGAVEEAARQIRERGDGGTVWFVGHWGFQYYAEREGMQPINAYSLPDSPIPLPPRSSFHEGDWLVLPEWRFEGEDWHFAAGVHRQRFLLDETRTRPEFTVVMDDPIPLQTIMTLYSGFSAVKHREGARLRVEVFRVVEDHDAEP
jgi:hypothetical protein